LIGQRRDERLDAISRQVQLAEEKAGVIEVPVVAEIRQRSCNGCLSRASGAAEPQNPALSGLWVVLDEPEELIENRFASVWMTSSTSSRVQSVVKRCDSRLRVKSLKAPYDESI
jgi:hypothetical protein